jgi:hypothetical protein
MLEFLFNSLCVAVFGYVYQSGTEGPQNLNLHSKNTISSINTDAKNYNNCEKRKQSYINFNMLQHKRKEYNYKALDKQVRIF